MTPRNHRRAIVLFFFYVAALFSIPSPARAEDIDIFSINPGVGSQRPNVLIVLDSSANWASTDSVAGGKKYQHVAAAMVTTIGALTDQFNVGLMMFAETGSPNDNIDGGVMRAGVRQMTATNRQKLVDFFANVDADFDKSNNTTMGLAFYEAYLYFTGQTGYSGIGKAKRDYGGAPVNRWATVGASNQGASANMQNAVNALYQITPNALTDSSSVTYNSPMTDACQKNFIIYIANGTVTDPNSANSDATTKLAQVGGAGATNTIPFTENDGDQGNISDEWTRFLANNDLTTAFPGSQKIVTYTVEVNPVGNTQGLNNTQLLKSVGNKATGNGGYFGVSSAGGGAEIAIALNKIFAEIQSINSVFAASTLPVSVNVRGSFLNQVYMGVFRPDPNSSPRWPGNVKQYALGKDDTGNVFLVDKNNAPIENVNTGFITPSSVSFWSTPSIFWDTTYYPDIKTDAVPATVTDAPDGEFVEKGGAAQHLRTVHETNVTTRTLYTCLTAAGCTPGVDLTGSANYQFNSANVNITDAMLGITAAIPVSSLTHTAGTTIATATATAHGFSSNAVVKIENANESPYNGTFNVTVLDANTFQYTITETPVSPATPSTGIKAGAAGGTSATVASGGMTHGSASGTPPMVTVSVTTVANHGFTNNQSITITGANETAYNGTYTISTSGGNTFTYQIVETPVTPPTGDSTAQAKSPAVGGTAKNVKINNPGAIPAVTRSGTTVTVQTQNNHGFSAGATVLITNLVPSEYSGTFTIASVPALDKFTYNLASTGPATPGTGTIVASSGPVLDVSSITRSGTTATVTTTTDPTLAPASLANGSSVTISGANQTEYNGTFTIANVNATNKTFTYTVAVHPTSPDTSTTITATGAGGITKAQLINWVRGENTQLEDNPTATTTLVRGHLHGDVLHSRPAVINYNRSTDPLLADRDLVVYYGSNDGIIHAVKGGQNDADGNEKWGFIPSEFYQGFARMYLQSPITSAAAPRTYFADGPISVDAVYRSDTTVTPPEDRMDGAGARAQIYVGMRRGGRFYYSLDVTDPDVPVYKWKIDNTGDFAELGQSWSEAKVAKVKISSSKCPSALDSQGNCKVLIFGAGYDAAANDPVTQGTATMGRGIFVVDAITGTLIWHASPTAITPSAGVHKLVAGMTYAIPADLAVVNSDLDVQNVADRIYAADTGGNIWRVNISDPDPVNWGVGKVAALSGSGAANQRKFLFAPDVVAFDSTTDSILIGSGDREHPFDNTVLNRYYMIKDSHALTDLPSTVATEDDLVDLTLNLIQDGTAAQAAAEKALLATKKGWMIRLRGIDPEDDLRTEHAGEKVVTGATTLGGTTFFATNTPTQSASGTCTGSLGLAVVYAVSFRDATATIDFNGDGVLSGLDLGDKKEGGGLPPTPIPFSTEIDGKFYEGAISGTRVDQPPTSPIGQRYRVFWNLSVDN